MLLRQYADNNSDDAFTALVTRHINLVYSVALRQAGNPHAAQEITQTVFIILARKAASLRHDKALTGWLFQTTRLTANNFIRSEIRRLRREGEAYMQSVLDETGTEVWSRIAPLLDSAVAGLREKDRQAILLRFYEGRNLRDVGLAVGASEDAAEKRVNRALEKLRSFFAKRGVSSTTAILAGTISANSVHAAPVALAKTVTAVALAKGATASISTLTLVKGALKIMAWTKAKTAVVTGVVVLLTTASVTPYVWYYHLAPDAWRNRFEAAYSLKNGELLRYIPPPFIRERMTYYRTDETNQARAIPSGPDYVVFRQSGSELRRASMGFGYKQHSLQQILGGYFNFWRYEFDDPDQLLNISLPGDWTIREDANREDLLAALEPIIQKAAGRRIHFEKRAVERDVIVAHGTAKDLDWQTKVQIYAEKKVQGGDSGTSHGNLQGLVGAVGEPIGIYMINEAKTVEPEPKGAASFGWDYYLDANSSKMGDRREELTDKVLKNVAEQTGLTFTRERRPVDVWFVTEQR